MNWDEAIERIESGDARMVVTQAVLLCDNGRIWISFDGDEWADTDIEIARNQFGIDMAEQVNHPAHYQKGGRECIDVMIEEFGVDAVIAFCKCNDFKYRWRAGLKEGNSAEQDLAKAAWYRNKATELENDNL